MDVPLFAATIITRTLSYITRLIASVRLMSVTGQVASSNFSTSDLGAT